MSSRTMLNPLYYGAVAAGSLYPLSTLADKLGVVQRRYPFAVSLNESRDRCALQDVLHRAVSLDSHHLGRAVLLPPGDYYLDKTLTLDTARGLIVQGCGAATRLIWHGPRIDPALRLVLCNNCQFRDLTIHAEDPASSCAIHLTNRTGPSDGIVSTACQFHNVHITRFKDSVNISYDQAGGAPDANNDLHWFEHCTFDQFTQTGVIVSGGQSHFLRFIDCTFQAASNQGTKGLWCAYGAFVHLDGCIINSCETGVQLDQFFPGVCSIDRCNGEGCRRWLATSLGGGHGGVAPVSVTRSRISCAPQEGDAVMDFNHNGPIVIRENFIDSITPVKPIAAIRWAASRVTHQDNLYVYDGVWDASALMMFNQALPPSMTDVGNLLVDRRDQSCQQFDNEYVAG